MILRFLPDRESLQNRAWIRIFQNIVILLLYTYNFTIQNWTRDYVIRYAREKNLKLVSVGFYFSWCDYNVNCSPLEFSDVIRQAQCMVTTTFHGSVMGVMNHKKLLAVPFRSESRGSSQETGNGERCYGDADVLSGVPGQTGYLRTGLCRI